MIQAETRMRVLGDMMGSVTRAFEETHVGRLIKALLLQPSESYHPLMPSTLLKNIQRLTCTRRLQNVGTLSFPAGSRFRYHRYSVPGRYGCALNVTRPVDHLIARKAAAQGDLKCLGGLIDSLIQGTTVSSCCFERSFQHGQLGTQHVFKLAAVVPEGSQIHD
jgi:hypothetical protein